ncbi:hypothetical protein LTR56_010953 [Elasticomyces elasticus]|nr:hypothetical protein LTR56_010953 [Elasticomyces elasticus]KAK3662651.1 hypothetical protein LTR22_006501 [Elasticomyces elasticus]KAK4926565.1 hypothetical protein LTR49_006499 [Elasticomyces elasticus]KAK5760658.1 hypothetical protein LTS12_009195 [Elasticomyces elasticus]
MAHHYRPPYTSASSNPDIHLKPMYATTTTPSLNSSASNEYYNPVSQYPLGDGEVQRLEARDVRLKKEIRILRLVSRIIATILAGVTLAPLVMTLIKFLQTRNTYYTVDGQQRTAWAANTQTWYMYLYLGVAAMSFAVNLLVLLSYCCGVKAANATANATGWWEHLLTAVHLAGWIASVAIYRYGKEALANGHAKDLWGWTCSPAAEKIQSAIPDVDFSKYCTLQTSSFYTGAVNVVTTLISVSIYLLMVYRTKSKARLNKKTSYRVDDAREPLRG